jgi:uncharacterized protein YuzE
LGSELQTVIQEPRIRYYPETDTMAIEVRDSAERPSGDEGPVGGEDLVIHYAAAGEPWLWEIEHASRHPEHIAAVLEQISRRGTMAAE